MININAGTNAIAINKKAYFMLSINNILYLFKTILFQPCIAFLIYLHELILKIIKLSF